MLISTHSPEGTRVAAKADYREHSIRMPDGITLNYREYGSRFSAGTSVLCLAGLTRNAKDFHDLASNLSKSRRVICLDARGRGKSDHDPKYSNYNLITEVGDVIALVTSTFDKPAVVIGTSRGGLQALVLNAVRGAAVAGIVLNDIGPEIEIAGLVKIVGYLGLTPDPLETWDDAVIAMKATHEESFPNLSQSDWVAWAKRTFRDDGGRPVLDYDPKLRDAVLEAETNGSDFWPQFRALGPKPVLTLRGEHSDILSQDTVNQMRRAKPDMTAVTVKGRGHVPFLDEPEAVSAITTFLQKIDDQSFE